MAGFDLTNFGLNPLVPRNRNDVNLDRLYDACGKEVAVTYGGGFNKPVPIGRLTNITSDESSDKSGFYVGGTSVSPKGIKSVSLLENTVQGDVQ